jgi:hypothetical protein
MVEVVDLLAERKVLEQRRAARARLARVEVVADRHTVVCRHPLATGGHALMQFTALTRG